MENREVRRKQHYVLGLAFTNTGVLMVKKNRPKWQEGLLNFVGGKVEDEETCLFAMIREFKEETGIETEEKNWKYFGFMQREYPSENGDDFAVSLYYTEPNDKFLNFQTMEDEEIFHITHDKFEVDSAFSTVYYISNILAIYQFARSLDCTQQGAKLNIWYP